MGGLESWGHCAILYVMKPRSTRQIFILFLAVLVTAGMGMSAVQAADMTVRKAMTSDMSASGHGDCTKCSGSNGADGKVMVCPPACIAPVVAVLPPVGPVIIMPVVTIPSVPRDVLLSGSASAPDPYPPRLSDLV